MSDVKVSLTAGMFLWQRLAAVGEVWGVDLSDALWLVVGSVGCEQGNGPSQSTAGNGGNPLAGGRGLTKIQGFCANV